MYFFAYCDGTNGDAQDPVVPMDQNPLILKMLNFEDNQSDSLKTS